MPLLEQLQAYKVTAYNTRHQEEGKLSVGGVITPILCAAGVQVDKRRSTPPGWMDIKFCKTNLLIEHKELDGSSNSSSPSLAGPSKLLLPNPELTTESADWVSLSATTMKKRRKRSHKLDRVSRKRQPQLHGALLMAVYHLQTTT
ncbi:unnamed protein product [Microthlaspi erraticum]|uniref:Arabidopsis retrotransposon Orf1 C-terminal domain-containing protein n=1 Tax=Microthlaspi erraticum TaxID=1685480 RepID=A0A6D2IB44_9BRAS|nr:unnamed protein product [Microthlaspi erraticum]